MSAPTSSKLTSGMVAKPSRCDEGCTTDSAAVKSSAPMHSGASSDRLSGAGPTPPGAAAGDGAAPVAGITAAAGASAASDSSATAPFAAGSACPASPPPTSAETGTPPRCLPRSPKILLIAIVAASRVSAARSAPTNPGVPRANVAQFTPPPTRRPRASVARIRARAASSGMPREISRSKRPARRRAGSIESGRLVAPMTITFLGSSGSPSSSPSSSAPSPSSSGRSRCSGSCLRLSMLCNTSPSVCENAAQ